MLYLAIMNNSETMDWDGCIDPSIALLTFEGT